MNKTSTRKLERRLPNQQRARLTKQKILSAAHKILIRDGVQGLTTRSLAKEAGLSVGAIYQYFPNKQAVLFWIYKKRLDERLAIFDQTLAQRTEGETIEASFFRYLESLRRARMWSRLDLELGYAEEREEELRKYTEVFNMELSCRYVKVWKDAGSTWSEEKLLMLARYMNELDHLNRKLQQGETKQNREYFGALTTEIFRHLNCLNGSLDETASRMEFDFSGKAE